LVTIAATAVAGTDANATAVPATANCSSPTDDPYSDAARLIPMFLLRLQGRYACLKVIELRLDLAKLVLNR
jgi:hypothetical protein